MRNHWIDPLERAASTTHAYHKSMYEVDIDSCKIGSLPASQTGVAAAVRYSQCHIASTVIVLLEILITYNYMPAKMMAWEDTSPKIGGQGETIH